MKLQILSDLHFEHHRDYGEALIATLDFKAADVVILAGDIVGFGSNSLQALQRMKALCEQAPGTVLYLPGNHEYYGTSPAFVEHCLSLFAIHMGIHRRVSTLDSIHSLL